MEAVNTGEMSRMTKKEIRKEILQKRDALSKEDRIEKSRRVVERLFQTEAYQKAERVLCYISFRSEVMTGLIAARCYQDGKQFYAPKIIEGDMLFYPVLPYEEMERNSMGILESVSLDKEPYRTSRESDLMILPGTVFDREGNRVGYGGGYYDRFLSKGFSGSTIALAYECQIVPSGSFEVEPTDIRPEMILTEETTFETYPETGC